MKIEEYSKTNPLKTPVLFLVFNRPDSTEKVFNEIRKAEPKQLFIAADGPREGNQNDEINCKKVIEIVKSVNWSCEVKTLFREKNLGCKYGVSGAIDWFFKNVEEGIILEDDCLPSQSFFWYCQELLEKYRFNKKIFSISGRNHLGKWKSEKADYFFSTGGIWGWATWKRAWKHLDIELLKFYEKESQKKLKEFRKKCPAKGKEIIIGCKKIIKNNLSSWAYPWFFSRIINDGYSIISSKNQVKNIGFGSNATHTTNKVIFEPDIYNIDFPLKHNFNFFIDYEYLNKYKQKQKLDLYNKFKILIKKLIFN